MRYLDGSTPSLWPTWGVVIASDFNGDAIVKRMIISWQFEESAVTLRWRHRYTVREVGLDFFKDVIFVLLACNAPYVIWFLRYVRATEWWLWRQPFGQALPRWVRDDDDGYMTNILTVTQFTHYVRLTFDFIVWMLLFAQTCFVTHVFFKNWNLYQLACFPKSKFAFLFF